MSLETATHISDLVTTNPVATDLRSQGDDHLRMLKQVLQTTFPNASKAFRFPTTSVKSANFSVLDTEQNTTFLVTTTSGAVVATLPSLASGDAGWECFFIKLTTDTNALFIAPPAGTIQSGEVSGLSRTRRCIPGHKTRVMWTGTTWIAERVVKVPVGATIEFTGASLPVGYEWPNGQTLASASTDYPEYYLVNGNSGVTPDDRGRVVAGKDDMGGTSANRLTNQSGGINGDVLGATGGSETHTLTQAQMPSHNHNVTDPGHDHDYRKPANPQSYPYGTNGANASIAYTDGESTSVSLTNITINNTGGGEAHNNVQPTIIRNKLLVVE